jgi:hypothetical protein
VKKVTRIKAKAKTVAYRFISHGSDDGFAMYPLLRELIEAHHPDLAQARIALAWNLTWTADVDGRVTLGKCKKVGDLERECAEFAAFDFVIILRREFWYATQVTDLQRRALLDHELHHAAVKYDERGEPVIDECGRQVFRIRAHDLEEFAAIADRYGCWKKDLECFAQALDRARQLTADRWIGYRSLQQDLAAAGVSIPIEAIREWTDAERREASTWAVLRQQFPGRSVSPLPALLARAAEAKEIGA